MDSRPATNQSITDSHPVASPTLRECQCPICKSRSLRSSYEQWFDPTQIYEDGIVCESCGQGFDVVWGVPFLGVFEEADVLSLIEIAANADNYTRASLLREESPTGAAGLEYARWHDLLEGYHLSSDRQAFLAGQGVSAEVLSWLPNRYGEHVLFRSITAGLALSNKHVLDVGAGSGFDSYKFVRAGSHVTCLEFSPILAHAGLRNVPQARWIGGSSKVLPFSAGAFDLVVANAALHHIRDIPRTISEMLRVLKPGGYLLTLCDSYRRNDSDETVEIKVFKDNPAVLSGVNENIPRFDDFVSSLLKHRDRLDIRIFTSEVHGVQRNWLARTLRLPRIGTQHGLHPKEWALEEALDILPTTSGGLALLVRLEHAISDEQLRPADGAIRPGTFARSLGSQASAVAELASHIPSGFVDLPLLDERHRKFRLLNGWKPTVPGQGHRTAYHRARVYHTYRGWEALHVTVLAPYLQRCDSPTLELLLNGRLVARRLLCRGLWTNIVVPIDSVERDRVVTVELRLTTALAEDEAKLFHVRHIGFGDRRPEHPRSEADLERYGLEAVADIGLLSSNPVRMVVSDDYAHAISTLNRLRTMGFDAEVIAPKEQQRFFLSEPRVKVVGAYDEFSKKGSAGFDSREGTVLIVAEDRPSAEVLRSLCVDERRWAHCFAVLPGGHVVVCGRASRARWVGGAAIGRIGAAVTAFTQVLAQRLKRAAASR